MAQMTDPMKALILFQQAFERGQIPVQQGRLGLGLLFAPDQPNGKMRFSYMRAEGRTLTALVMFAQSGMKGGHPVFNIGYAVPEANRGRGLAKSTLVAALAELTAGLGVASVPTIHVEAVIDVNHTISQRVASTIFDEAPTAITDSESGLPALHYIRKIEIKENS